MARTLILQSLKLRPALALLKRSFDAGTRTKRIGVEEATNDSDYHQHKTTALARAVTLRTDIDQAFDAHALSTFVLTPQKNE